MANRYSTHFRQSSVGPGFQLAFGGVGGAGAQQPQLISRINEKKIELENLKQLRDLSANLAKQLRELEAKLGTLSDGSEVVATVLANWHNVLRAISLASAHLQQPPKQPEETDMDEDKMDEGDEETQGKQVYPEMLVRIPTQLHDDQQAAEAEPEYR
ncbi:hypothetical protein AOL_s00188g69 [Orbilia oligospora ATCC 24927]|uniref:DASH complex subunit DAD2 n=1 Tax=Arthrobotrys oligospora (strain ATCC 24927 / CBS 115.81 / DSM 1491) TaxID=756982 RepID=G1XQ58_ARTOA|nr:hypothetical protein AOL_s00188g69 [Orbilia oligospora ATCC 24927]EGX44731.1 hypothetical protein AOL_s00188g69 [Orbilia oligospora ATCC 24927]